MQYRWVDPTSRVVIERLRGLPPFLRYPVYAACALLVFFVAGGVGAMAAVVVGGPPDQVAARLGGSAGSGALESAAEETTNDAETATSGQPADETSFVHRATDENSRGDYTYISRPSIDGDANAIVLVVPSLDRRGDGSASYNHNIGVWYEFPDKKKWAIFNQDRAAVPAEATFEVVVRRGPDSFVHRAELVNTAGNRTYLDDPLTNGHPDAVVSVTQNWNPGGGRGVYNNHPVGVLYDEDVEKWAVYNRDDAPMPDGAAFNIAVSESAEPAR
jgi:hypothetical protein